MFSNNVVIEWKIIIPTLICLSLIVIVRSIMLNNKIANITRQYMVGNYQEILPKAIKMQNFYGQTLFTKNRNVRGVYDDMSLIIATIHLHQNNDKEFLKYINEIGGKDNQCIKFFWLYVYYLINNDLDSAFTNYDLMNDCSNLPEITKLAAEALLANNNGNTDEAFRLFDQWLNKECPKNPILKEILLKRIGEHS